jgi:GTP cyclohydrolase II
MRKPSLLADSAKKELYDERLANRLVLLKKIDSLLEHKNNGSELTTFLVNLLKTEGAVVSQQHGDRDKGVDMALWIDSLESSLGNPILVEIKMSCLTEDQLKIAEDQLRRYLTTTNSRSGLLLYLDREKKRFRRATLGMPLIIRLDIRDLINELRTKTLSRVLLSERNAMVHQGE